MKLFASCCLLISLYAHAQEGVLDPSIFDGTGRELEKAEPQTPAASAPEQKEKEPSAGPEENAETGSQAPAAVPIPEGEGTMTEPPREIVLPGTESPNEEESAPPGTPANSSAQESRAGERVESTEKIAPGQAVDFPWDM